LRRHRWRQRKLQDPIVQLQRRAQVKTRNLRRLYPNDAVAIGEVSRTMYIPGSIQIDGCATFAIQDLVQPLFRTGLLRRFLPIGEQKAWAAGYDTDYHAECDPVHPVIILLTCGRSKRVLWMTEARCTDANTEWCSNLRLSHCYSSVTFQSIPC
jgi:hypothetical protein